MRWILEDSCHSTVTGNHFPILKRLCLEMFFLTEVTVMYSPNF